MRAQADIIIVNTCSFIKEAKEESVETILEVADRKHDGRCRLLVVTGCLPQRYQEELAAELPEVDIFVGTGDCRVSSNSSMPRSAQQRRSGLGDAELPLRPHHPAGAVFSFLLPPM